MTVEFRLPDVGEGVAEGEIVRWLVEPGDRVSEDQPVAEVETDKAVVEVPAPLNGTVAELRAAAGDVVPVGEVIITFEEDGDGASDAAESDAEAATDDAESDEDTSADAATAAGGRVFAPPSVRRLARELGVDLSAVDGSGPSGRITEMDVRVATESDAEAPEASAADTEDAETPEASAADTEDAETVEDGTASEDAPPETTAATATAESVTTADRDRTLAVPATRRLAGELGVDIDAVPATEHRNGDAVVSADAVRAYAESMQAAESTADAETAAPAGDGETGATAESEATPEGPVRREPYRGVRRTIGEAMATSKYTAPHVTHHDRVDATGLVEARERLQPLAEDRGVKLTYLPIVMKAVAAALAEHPVLNTELDEDAGEILYKEYYNLGVATATDAGLMVPVVEGVDEKGLLEIASETRSLVEAARDRSIAREDMQGGTFTITNFGAVGGEYATPIVNYPETAVLGLGELAQRPVVEGGSLSDPGEVVARPVLPLSLSIDHRVIDGAEAAAFVNTLTEYLEDPTRLLLD